MPNKLNVDTYPSKWINNTREFCPKGQFVYFVGNLVKLQVNI